MATETGGTWVAVKCHYRCRSCMQRTPLNHLDFDGDVECLRCGDAQTFDVGQWVDALAHARQVGRAAPTPDGGTWASWGDDTHNPHRIVPRTLVLRAMPGTPPCPACSHQLSVDRCMAGMLRVRCGGCSWKGTFVLPRGIRTTEPRLGGAIAAAHAKGAAEATVQADPSGVAVVRCPHCGAPADHRPDATVVHCAYCHVTVRVPTAELRRLGHELEPELWWLWFTE